MKISRCSWAIFAASCSILSRVGRSGIPPVASGEQRKQGDAALLSDGSQGEGFAADLEHMRSRARTIPAEFVKQPVETEFADERLKALGIVEEHGGSVRGVDARF